MKNTSSIPELVAQAIEAAQTTRAPLMRRAFFRLRKAPSAEVIIELCKTVKRISQSHSIAELLEAARLRLPKEPSKLASAALELLEDDESDKLVQMTKGNIPKLTGELVLLVAALEDSIRQSEITQDSLFP